LSVVLLCMRVRLLCRFRETTSGSMHRALREVSAV
jgi:hypothetical protein